MQHFSLQHQTLLLSPVTSTTGYCFCFGSIPSFFLELFLHWSPVAYWAPTDLGSSSFSILSFCLFIRFMGFSRQEYWSGLPFPSPVDHILIVAQIHEFLIAKFRLKLKKVGKTTRPFRYDLNQIPYDYTLEVRSRFKVSPSTDILTHVCLCSLEKGMANHFSILALRTPWTVWEGKR